MKDQLIEGFSESIKMQLYEHRLSNLPSEKARKRPNRHTNSLSRLPNRLAKGGSSYLYESRTRRAINAMDNSRLRDPYCDNSYYASHIR